MSYEDRIEGNREEVREKLEGAEVKDISFSHHGDQIKGLEVETKNGEVVELDVIGLPEIEAYLRAREK